MPTLTPGSTPNWTATATPAQQGNPLHLAHSAPPIAVWTATSVNFDKFSLSRRIGVVALHACGPQNGNCGIEKVRFIANNGSPLDVTAPTINTQSGYWEFWCDVAVMATDGIVEVRAIIYPSSGVPLVMQGGYITTLDALDAVLPEPDASLLLWSNANGTYNGLTIYLDAVTGSDTTGNGSISTPWASISAAVNHLHYTVGQTSHCTIILGAGDYEMHAANNDNFMAQTGWLTFKPASGVARDSVKIVGRVNNHETRIKLIHALDLSLPLYLSQTSAFFSGSALKRCFLWCEGVLMESDRVSTFNSGQIAGGAAVQRYMHKSATYRNRISNGREMAQFVQMQDFHIYNTSRDVASGNRLTRGFKVEGIRANYPVGGGDPDHVDYIQTFSTFSGGNSIWMDGEIVLNENVNGLIFNDRLRDRIAFVNLVLSCPTGAGTSYSFGGQNCIYWHLTMPDQRLFLLSDPNNLQGDNGGIQAGKVSINACIVSLGYLSKTDGSFPVGLSYADYASNNSNIISRNHLLDGSQDYGINSTYGTPTWLNPSVGNFYPNSGLTRSVPRFLLWDAHQNERLATTMHGAMEAPADFALVPTIAPLSGRVLEPTQTVSMNVTFGTIYFTRNGTTPTNVVSATNFIYSGPVTPSNLVKAVTYNGAAISEVVDATYTVISNGTPAPPTNLRFTP